MIDHTRNRPLTQAGWKFTVVNRERFLVRVGVSDLDQASKVALQQIKGGRIKKQVQLSALEVEQLNITGRYSVTIVRSGNENR